MGKAPKKKQFWLIEDGVNNIQLGWTKKKPSGISGGGSNQSTHVISADYHDWKIAEMQKEIDELVEALEFYANRDNYDWYINISLPPSVKDRENSNVKMDYGKRARNVLSKHKPKDQNDNT